MPTALITGITGQDGSYLCELLLNKGYTVHGVVRRASAFNRSRIEHLRQDAAIYERTLFLHYADLSDVTTLRRILTRTQADEVYHLAGQSHVGLSFDIPESTCSETGGATLALLEICRDLPTPPKFYHASSSEVFGAPAETPQNEDTAFRPISPYGCSKAFATNLCRVYRESYGLFVCNGISFNHESPRRGENFVTRKITHAAGLFANGSGRELELGNLSSVRDWGYAPEYVEAMWRALQHATPGDYVFATGTTTSVRDFARAAFDALGIAIEFEGHGSDEVGRECSTGRTLIRVNSNYFRPVDSQVLVGDARRAAQMLGWKPSTAGIRVAACMALAEHETRAPAQHASG